MLLSHGHPLGTGTVTLLSAPPSRQVTGWEVRSFLKGAKSLMVWGSSPDRQRVPGPRFPEPLDGGFAGDLSRRPPALCEQTERLQPSKAS